MFALAEGAPDRVRCVGRQEVAVFAVGFKWVWPLSMAAACGHVQVYMKSTSEGSGPDYVVVESRGAVRTVYDCRDVAEESLRSRCVRVQFANPPSVRRNKAWRDRQRVSIPNDTTVTDEETSD